MRVVRRRLEIPDQLTGIRVQRDNRAGPEIAAFAALPRIHRIGIARSPIEKIQLGVIRARHPRHPAAVFHGSCVGPCLGAGLAFARLRIPAPLQGSGFRIARFQIPGNVHGIAAHADNDVIPDDHGRHGGEVLQLDIGNLNFPALLAVLRVKRNEPAVRR